MVLVLPLANRVNGAPVLFSSGEQIILFASEAPAAITLFLLVCHFVCHILYFLCHEIVMIYYFMFGSIITCPYFMLRDSD